MMAPGKAQVRHQSVNQLEMLSFKAARGAGLYWGIAEEAGKAIRWLVMHGLPAAEPLVGVLERIDGTRTEDLMPVIDGCRWLARTGALCPLTAGITLCDLAGSIDWSAGIETGPILFPVLMLPFAAACAQAESFTIEVAWDGTEVLLDGDSVRLAGDRGFASQQAPSLRCRMTGTARDADALERSSEGVDLAEVSRERLERFAGRTYVPASDISRATGAGAGLTDND